MGTLGYITVQCYLKAGLKISLNRAKKTGVAMSGTRPGVLREYVYVNG